MLIILELDSADEWKYFFRSSLKPCSVVLHVVESHGEQQFATRVPHVKSLSANLMTCLCETVAVFPFSRATLPNEWTYDCFFAVVQDHFVDFVPHFSGKVEETKTNALRIHSDWLVGWDCQTISNFSRMPTSESSYMSWRTYTPLGVEKSFYEIWVVKWQTIESHYGT